DLAQPIDVADKREVPDVTAVPPQQVDHARVFVIHGEIERRVVVVQLVRVQFGAALDEQPGDLHRIVRRGDVQRALLTGILHFDRRAEIEQQYHNIGAVLLRRGKYRL